MVAVKGYYRRGSYFCLDHYRPKSGDEPLDEVPPYAACIECRRLLSEVAEEHYQQPYIKSQVEWSLE